MLTFRTIASRGLQWIPVRHAVRNRGSGRSALWSRPGALQGVGVFLAGVAFAAMAPEESAAQRYGGSVAVSDGSVLVGETANVSLPGIVYVYRPTPEGWGESARLMISPAAALPDGFGRSLDADGSRVLIGAPGLNGGRGAAVVFERGAGGAWREVARLTPGGGEHPGEEGARFGAAVALGGNTAIVSATGEDEGKGALYVFTQNASGTWTQRSRVQPADGGGAFGTIVALDDSRVLVATAGRRDSPGAVYAYRLDPASGQLAPRGRLEPASEMELNEGRSYGSALGVRSSVALIGTPTASRGAGKVFVFRHDATVDMWTPAQVLSPFDGEPRSGFGTTIAFDGDDVWIGAPGANAGSGSLYVFERNGEPTWSRVVKSSRPGLADRASFGTSASVAGDVAVVGAGGVDSRAGGAVIMERRPESGWSGGDLFVGDHRGLPSILDLEEEVRCEENSAAGFKCDNVNLIAFLPIKELGGVRGTRLNDVWGWTDPESGREIAIVGRTDGTSFVDVSDPYNPRMLGDLPKTPGSRSSVWRDMKVFRNHAYIVADGAGEHGVQVFDLRRLRDVAAEPVTFEADFVYRGIHSAHNIAVNEETGFAFSVGSSGGGETCGGGLHMMDLEDPGHPVFAGCFADPSTGRGSTGYSHDAQCVIYRGPDEDYLGREICLGSNETKLSIADVTDKDNPIAIYAIDYPNVKYAHQGWLSEDHRFFYMNDEGDEPQGVVEGTRTLVWDLMDLDDPLLAKEYIASTTDTDHNLYILDNLMYQSNYGAGLRILDISAPTDPVEIAYFDTTPYEGGASWSNYPYFESGIVVVTSTGDGLFIVRNTGRKNLIP